MHFQFSTLVHTRWVFLVWSVSLWETPPLTRQSEPWREGSAGSAVKNVFKEARWLCYCGKCQGSLLTTLWRSHIKTEMFWENHTSSSVNWKGNSNIKLKLKLWDPCFLEYTWLSTEWALKIIPLEVESERKETLEATLECVSSLPPWTWLTSAPLSSWWSHSADLPLPCFSELPVLTSATTTPGKILQHSHLNDFNAHLVGFLCNQFLYDPNRLVFCNRTNLP